MIILPIVSSIFLLSWLNEVTAVPVLHGDHAISGQHHGTVSSHGHLQHSQDGLHSQGLHPESDRHSHGSPEYHDDAHRWVDSLFADATDEHDQRASPSVRRSPPPSSGHPHDHTSASARLQADTHQGSQSHQEWLKWVDHHLMQDDDDIGLQPEHATELAHLSTPSEWSFLALHEHHAPQASSPSPSTSRSRENRPSTSDLSAAHRSTGTGAQPLIPPIPHPGKSLHRVTKSYWYKGLDGTIRFQISKGVDQIAVQKYGSSTTKRRSEIIKTLTNEQLRHLGKGLPIESMPGSERALKPSIRVRNTLSSTSHSPNTKWHNARWATGLTVEEMNSIIRFWETDLMAHRRGSSESTMNRLLMSLSHEELKSIAQGNEAARAAIVAKLKPQRGIRAPRERGKVGRPRIDDSVKHQ